MVNIEINNKWCKGCYICIDICPKQVLKKSNSVSERGIHQVLVSSPERCKICMLCEHLCPDLAIVVEQTGI